MNNLPDSKKSCVDKHEHRRGITPLLATPIPQDPQIDNLRGAGVLSVIGAGNNGSTSQVTSPGCVSNAITVGSTTKSDTLSSFSNMSSVVDLQHPDRAFYHRFQRFPPTRRHMTFSAVLSRRCRMWPALSQLFAVLVLRQVPLRSRTPGEDRCNAYRYPFGRHSALNPGFASILPLSKSVG